MPSTPRTLALLCSLSAAGLLVACSEKSSEPRPSTTGQTEGAGVESPEQTGTSAPDASTPESTETGMAPTEPAASEDPALAGVSVRGMGFELADGTSGTMDDYAGRVVLVVNTASRCGLTPQVAGLETLYQAHKDRGLVVLAFPSASFNQEPLASAEAAGFCQDMGATYPIASKVAVTGEDAHPLFRRLSERGGEPSWNFTKYLVDKSGRVVARFDPRTTPDDPELVNAIDGLLSAG